MAWIQAAVDSGAAVLAGGERRGNVVEPTLLADPGGGRRIRGVSVVGPVAWLDMPALELSGTEIRARAMAGGSIRFLVPEPVWRYVEEHGIYRPV